MDTSLSIGLVADAKVSTGTYGQVTPEVEKVLEYLSWIGCNRPRVPNITVGVVWHYALVTFFYLYVIYFLVIGTWEVIAFFDDYLWIIYATMVFKCMCVRIAIVNIRRRVNHPHFRSTLTESEYALNISQQYWKIVVFVDTLAMVIYYGVTSALEGVTWLGVLLEATFFLGTAAYVCYMAGAVLFSIIDTRRAQKRVSELIIGAEGGSLHPSQYDETYQEITTLVENSFWVDGILFIGAIINIVSAIAILLLYQVSYSDLPKVVSVIFLLFVLIILWTPDVAFFIYLGPEIAEVNELAIKLQVALADAKWSEWEGEMHRYDTLLKVLAKPIRYTAAGYYLDHKGVRSKLVGAIVAILLSVLRLVVMLAIET